MRVLHVGASGLLGGAVSEALEAEGDTVVRASRSGAERVDLTAVESIGELYRRVGAVDAVVCTAGVTPFGRVGELSVDDYTSGITDKLLGQVALVTLGLDAVSDRGSFTLTSGILSEDPITTGSVAATVDGGVDAFVRGTAIELPRGLRINSVSATVFEEAWADYGPFFPGFRPVPVAEAARAFVRSVHGAQTGQTYRVGY